MNTDDADFWIDDRSENEPQEGAIWGDEEPEKHCARPRCRGCDLAPPLAVDEPDSQEPPF